MNDYLCCPYLNEKFRNVLKHITLLSLGCCHKRFCAANIAPEVLVFPAGTDTGVARCKKIWRATSDVWSLFGVARGSLSVFLEVPSVWKFSCGTVDLEICCQ